MAYQDYENSAALGIPIELYDIYDSNGEHYRYNTSGETVSYLGVDYAKGIVEREKFGVGNENDSDNLTIKLSRGNTFTNQFRSNVIDAIVGVNVYRQHEANYVNYWSGYLTAVSFDENSMPSCRFEAIISSNIRMGCRRRNMRMCSFVLYGYGCGVNQESYKVSSTITNISDDGLTITSSEFATKADGWFQGGKIKVGTAWRLIKAHTTNTIIIDRAFIDAEITDSFTAYAGCDHTPTTCKAKFNNKLNFGGNEFLPSINPFKTNIGY